MHSLQLIRRYPIISEQINAATLGVVLGELEAVINRGVAGDVAEFGCYTGTTSLFIRRLLNALPGGPDRRFFAYDSFEGLPPKQSQDLSPAGSEFQAGVLKASKKEFLRGFHKAGLAPPLVYKAWFNDLTPAQLPLRLAYAFLDGDFYDSILTSLELCWPRLSPGGSITIDDYGRAALPGVVRAVTTFCSQHSGATVRLEHGIAIIHKLPRAER